MVASHRPSTALLLAVAFAGLAFAACGDGSSDGATVDIGDGRVPASRLAAAGNAVCRAAGEAPGDREAARTMFFADAHDGLHTIARALEDVDRKAAADLLMAKQAVEAAFTSEAPGADLGDKLARLAAATRTGLSRLDVDIASCRP